MPFSAVVGKCYVMYVKEYFKNKPEVGINLLFKHKSFIRTVCLKIVSHLKDGVVIINSFLNEIISFLKINNFQNHFRDSMTMMYMYVSPGILRGRSHSKR